MAFLRLVVVVVAEDELDVGEVDNSAGFVAASVWLILTGST